MGPYFILCGWKLRHNVFVRVLNLGLIQRRRGCTLGNSPRDAGVMHPYCADTFREGADTCLSSSMGSYNSWFHMMYYQELNEGMCMCVYVYEYEYMYINTYIQSLFVCSCIYLFFSKC